MIKHIKRWNKWRKFNANSWFHKLLVLLGLRNSPTFKFVLTDEEEVEFNRQIDEALGIVNSNADDEDDDYNPHYPLK